MSKKITLEVWAERNFEQPPKGVTLRRWARDCKIFPPAQKIGRAWLVEPNARYVDSWSTVSDYYRSETP